MKITKAQLKGIIKEIIEESKVTEESTVSKEATDYVRQAKNIFEQLDELIYKASTSKKNLNESDYAYFKEMVQTLIEQIEF